MSAIGDPLNNEVAELLERTDHLLRSSSVGGSRSPSETGRHSLRPSFFGRIRASASSVHSITETDGGEPVGDVGARLQGSFDAESRKHSSLKRVPTFTKSHDVGIQKVSELDDTGRPLLSVALAEGSSGSLDRSGPTSINLSLPGGSKDGARPYNSFGGLHEMVSMVDAFISPASPPPPVPTAGAAPSSRISFAAAGPFAGGGGKGSMAAIAADLKPKLRSPSRLGSAAYTPRSPLHKTSSLAAALSAPGAKGSRRAQLQSLLSKDVAQPQDVLKFKAEVKNLTQPAVNVVELAGELQEKFDRVNRKLKNWNLIETAATERFNAAMDAALDSLFSRINLAWPSGEQPIGASDDSAGKPSTSAYDSLRSRAYSKGGRQEPAQRGQADKDADHLPRRGRRYALPPSSSRRTDDADDGGYGSPSSSASPRCAWDEELSTTDVEEDPCRCSSRRGVSKESRTRSGGRGRAVAPGQQHSDARREAAAGGRWLGHDAGDPQPSARTDAEGRCRRSHQQGSDGAPGGAGPQQQPASVVHAWHVGPNGTYLTGHVPPAQPSPQQPAAPAAASAFGTGFPVPCTSTMFGALQQPFMSSSATYSGPSAAVSGHQVPLSALTGPCGGPLGMQHYGLSAAGGHGLLSSSVPGGMKPQDAQLTEAAWKLGGDLVGGFPFASSGLWTQIYQGSAAATNPACGVQPAGGANDSKMFRPNQGSAAVSYMAPTVATGRNEPALGAAAATAALDLCATASTAAMHSAVWSAPSAHSTVQVPATAAGRGAQDSSAIGPAPMAGGFDMADLRSALYSSLPQKAAYGYGPGLGGPNAPALASFTGLGDLTGNAAMMGIPNLPGAHTVAYGATGAMGPGHMAGQYLR